MDPWQIFILSSLLLTLVIGGGFFLSRHKHPLGSDGLKATQGGRLLLLSLWLASQSILAYIAFVFGKR